MTHPSFVRIFVSIFTTLARRILVGHVPKLFDAQFYLRENKDVAASGIDPFLHFVWRGASQNRDPAEDFDTAFFKGQSGPTRIDPVRYYLRYGAAAGLDPNPSFSTASYLIRYPDVAASGINPLQHYRTNGREEGRIATPSASQTLEIAALRSVSSRNIYRFHSDPERWFSIKFVTGINGELPRFESRVCLFLELSQVEVELLVGALRAISNGPQTEISLDIARDPSLNVRGRGSTGLLDRCGARRLDTVLAVFEESYLEVANDIFRISYAELRLWDLRGSEARVAEIFTMGALEVQRVIASKI